MTASLTRRDVREQIEQFLSGARTTRQIAAWAFDQTYAEAEGALVFEAEYEDLIDAILDDLVFADDPPFVLDPDAARQLLGKLEDG